MIIEILCNTIIILFIIIILISAIIGLTMTILLMYRELQEVIRGIKTKSISAKKLKKIRGKNERNIKCKKIRS